MRKCARGSALIPLVCLLFSLSCSSRIDTKKFGSAYHAGKAVESATEVGTNITRFQELVQEFATEVSILNDRAKSYSPEERHLLQGYADILQLYRDSLTLWEAKARRSVLTLPRYEGRLPISNELCDFYGIPHIEEIVKRNKLPIVALHPDSKDSSPGVSDSSIQLLWAEASKRLEKLISP